MLEGLLGQARRFVSGVVEKTDSPIVLLQGGAGSGRSSMLAQFAHEMSSGQAHASQSVAVGAGGRWPAGSSHVAAIAHGVRVPVGPATLPSVLGRAGEEGAHGEAAGAKAPVSLCLCVMATRDALGVLGQNEGTSFGRLLEAAASQLYLSCVGASALAHVRARRRGNQRGAADDTGRLPRWGSVESLVRAVLVAHEALGRRLVVVLDGLVFNEAVYLASRLAVLCQRGPEVGGGGGSQGLLCRKAWFLISTKPPGVASRLSPLLCLPAYTPAPPLCSCRVHHCRAPFKQGQQVRPG